MQRGERTLCEGILERVTGRFRTGKQCADLAGSGATIIGHFTAPPNLISIHVFDLKGPYLAVANHRDDSTYNLDSKIYRWNGTSFAEFQAVPTHSAFGWEFFTIDGDVYLAVANYYNGSTYNLDSEIYKAKLANRVGLDAAGLQSAWQVGGYVQLDTLTAAPPAADCDEDSERGRMKVDIVNNVLYICAISGWVSK